MHKKLQLAYNTVFQNTCSANPLHSKVLDSMVNDSVEKTGGSSNCPSLSHFIKL